MTTTPGDGAAGARPVVLDVMGGDAAPGPALDAARTLADGSIPVLLCGPPDLLAGVGLPVLPATGAVGMADDALTAVRRNPGSSVCVAAAAVADGRAAALVSAGSTGAVVVAATLYLGRAPGVRRAALAARIPTPGRVVTVLDVGAAPSGDHTTLVSHTRLGLDHVRGCGHPAPTAALLNVGTEPLKGPARIRRALVELAGVTGFRGGIEPADALAGAVDVVVTDGFTGNLLLKTVEALGAGKRPVGDAAAVLLGVRGTVLVAHGAAGAADLVAAVRMADRLVRSTPTAPGDVPTAQPHHPVT